MVALRSLAYNILFYLTMIGTLVVATPVYFFLPHSGNMAVVRFWSRTAVFLLERVCGLKMELRGVENIPPGGVIIAAKHQSLWETFALVPLLRDPCYVIKAQLFYVPVWGWWAWKAGMIRVDRGSGSAALRQIEKGARRELARGRRIMIFPEGTRVAPGAPPDYRFGVTHLYAALNVPVVPVALNSGLYWPRRRFLRHPGTIVVEFLPPIEPGLGKRAFAARLVADIEGASDRLLIEADRAVPRPPFPPVAAERLKALKEGAAAGEARQPA